MTTELVELIAEIDRTETVPATAHPDCNALIKMIDIDDWHKLRDGVRALASRAGGLDHRDLLAKYMTYVGDVEGIDFVSSGYRGYDGDQKFEPEEWAELTRISDEVNGAAAPEPVAVG